ncbi:ATP-binding cassette domain-containing protein [Reinekea marina]|uniref:ATP-binding cassette domain-containing protein n=2 Tax=Reinekea marina TaxID=1310421 RepID=A0ABV7WSV6_9GAMM
MKHSVSGMRAQTDVDMQIEWQANSRIALVGSSGAGKTTLLRSIAGFESELSEHGSFQSLHPWQRSCSYLHQQPVMFAHQTVSQTFAFSAEHRHQRYADLPFNDWISWLGITELLNKKCSDLSGGQQQRVALIRALFCQPKLLLLDESFASLDRENVLQACRVIDDYSHLTNSGFILASHQDKPLRMLCREVVVVEDLKTKAIQPLFNVLNQQLGGQLKTTLTCHCVELEHQFLASTLEGQTLYAEQPEWWQPGLARFTLDASSVSISLADRAQTSLVNRLNVTIDSHQQHGSDHFKVWLTLGETGFWAIVSHWSWDRLGLHDGQSVFAEFKVGALEWSGQWFQ